MKKEIKFFNTGKYAQHKPYLPIVTVSGGDVLKVPEEISKETADHLVDCQRAEWVEVPEVPIDYDKLLKEEQNKKGKKNKKNR